MRYTTAGYRRAVYRAADAVYPLPLQLAKQPGEKYGDHKKRLAKQWAEVLVWQQQHRFHPHQMRHSYGTEARKKFGLDGAQRALGHAHGNVTQVYAAVALEKAIEVAKEIG